MELFHTTANEIGTIHKNGRFGEFFCFSSNVYVMVAGEYFTYSIEIDEDELINASSLFYHEDAEKLSGLVSTLCNRLSISEDEAEDLISEKVSGWDLIDSWDAEQDWDLQRLTASAAKILGYRGCIMKDEQGTLYMIDMLGREADLVKVNG
ncbi:hypothetical protein [Aquitalea magnusonii]|uniref:Uncharacterized protein n=1 Tax=Aquitalea magnusonii TaxID=332411 RepID=A0A318J6I6_9NEIS|nr:hypothetical protein [Aquitalea magnusonii]PXX42228.1 hypothetical protein DFR38_12025 [Aquitalea magnusonii]